MKTHVTNSDARHDAGNTHAIVSGVHHDISDASNIVSDVHRDVSNIHVIVSDIHHSELRSREKTGSQNPAASTSCALSVTEQLLTAV